MSELKTRLASLLAELEATSVPLYVIQHGKHKAVLVKYEEYEALLEKVDDLEDVVAMQQALLSPESESLGLEDHESQETGARRD